MQVILTGEEYNELLTRCDNFEIQVEREALKLLRVKADALSEDLFKLFEKNKHVFGRYHQQDFEYFFKEFKALGARHLTPSPLCAVYSTHPEPYQPTTSPTI